MDHNTSPGLALACSPLFGHAREVTTPLSPTPRTRVVRGTRARRDRTELHALLAEAFICHLGVSWGGSVRVLPTAYGIDLDGPDEGGTMYLHGSVAARSIVSAPEQDVCATVTVVDGLVLARSTFHHSMNYRSAVVIGRPRLVRDDAERLHGLERIVEQVCVGRTAATRDSTRKELAATAVLALPLHEASLKVRAGDPLDDESDIEQGGVWAGVLPVRQQFGDPVTSADCDASIPVPEHVFARAGR